MKPINLRPDMTIATLCAGTILGLALGVSGCAHGDKVNAPPVLPAARIDYTRPTGPQQQLIAGPVHEVERRANALLKQGWRIVPLSAAMTGDGSYICAMLVLEYRSGLK
jgi:hypothetical protein